MKYKFSLFILIASFSFSSISFGDFDAYQIAPCRFWMPNETGGFVCQNIPATILVPQAKSIAEVFKQQNARIAELEKQVADLVTLCKKP